jgi:hypothetical protein
LDPVPPSIEESGGSPPFSPPSLPNLTLWLPSSAASIGSGNLTWLDQGGHASNASQAATNSTIVAASSGVPLHVHFPGGGNSSLITGVWAAAIAANEPSTLYVLRKCTTTSTNGGWFKYGAPGGGGHTIAIDHDAFGAPGRTLANDGTGSPNFLTWNDNNTAWTVDVLVQNGSNVGTLYSGTTQKATGTFANSAAQAIGGSYLLGGLNFVGTSDDARDLAEVILYSAAHNPTQIATVVAFLLARIPP